MDQNLVHHRASGRAGLCWKFGRVFSLFSEHCDLIFFSPVMQMWLNTTELQEKETSTSQEKKVPLTKAAGRADVEDATPVKYPWHAPVCFWLRNNLRPFCSLSCPSVRWPGLTPRAPKSTWQCSSCELEWCFTENQLFPFHFKAVHTSSCAPLPLATERNGGKLIFLLL